MLGSITSLGERSRGRRWVVTYAWFVVGAVAGGVALASALIAIRAIGRLLPNPLPLVLGSVGVIVLLVVAALGRTPPSLDRQVNHRWLDQYRGWVIGAGFGFQLGAAVFTRVTSFALYLLAICALLGAPSWSLLAAGTTYAGIRAISAAPGGFVGSTYDLQRLIMLIARFEPRVGRAGRVADVLAAALVVVAVMLAAA